VKDEEFFGNFGFGTRPLWGYMNKKVFFRWIVVDVFLSQQERQDLRIHLYSNIAPINMKS